MIPPDLAIPYPRRWALVKLLEGTGPSPAR